MARTSATADMACWYYRSRSQLKVCAERPGRGDRGILTRYRKIPVERSWEVKLNLRVVAICCLAAFIAIPAFAESTGADTYKAKCAMCHGATGRGDTPAGKMMKVPSFKDPAIVKASDAQLIAAVKNGKGRMPASIGSQLSESQIKAVIAYIRTLQK